MLQIGLYQWMENIYPKSTGGSTGEVVVKKRMPFTVKTLKDDFEIVFLSKDGTIISI